MAPKRLCILQQKIGLQTFSHEKDNKEPQNPALDPSRIGRNLLLVKHRRKRLRRVEPLVKILLVLGAEPL